MGVHYVIQSKIRLVHLPSRYFNLEALMELYLSSHGILLELTHLMEFSLPLRTKLDPELT